MPNHFHPSFSSFIMFLVDMPIFLFYFQSMYSKKFAIHG
ncbi:hypothetical protein B4168_2160 [Anoxybacillus flavithermus]|nr:hypothetical protein B4168_2160 [Anoxybacillus flavithermus]OAO85817.1 hypothetical protein GT23_2720 [Parageobacillus thermoglucosidasius]